MNAEALLKLISALPALAPEIAGLIRSLIESRGYDVDKLLSAGSVINEQTTTHVNAEIARVEALLKGKGSDPKIVTTSAVTTPAKKIEDKLKGK